MLHTINSGLNSKSNTSKDLKKIRDTMFIPLNQEHRRKMSDFSQKSLEISSLTKKSDQKKSYFSEGKETFITINSRINQEERDNVRKKEKKQQEK
jgi:hypothetical protein